MDDIERKSKLALEVQQAAGPGPGCTWPLQVAASASNGPPATYFDYISNWSFHYSPGSRTLGTQQPVMIELGVQHQQGLSS